MELTPDLDNSQLQDQVRRLLVSTGTFLENVRPL
jgi:hypothetical protein